jgi:hypothetical protein
LLPRGSKNPKGEVIPGKSVMAMEMEVRDALVDNGAKARVDAMTAKRTMARNDILFIC